MANQLKGTDGRGSLSDPEADQQNQDERGHNEVRNYDDFDPGFANGRNVVVYIRISVKESMTIAKDVETSRQINEEENVAAIRSAGRAAGLISANIFIE